MASLLDDAVKPLSAQEDSVRQHAIQVQQELTSASLLNKMTSGASPLETQSYRSVIKSYAIVGTPIAA